MPPSYRTIAAPAEDEFIEKKSRFIGYIAPVTTEQEAAAFIESVRARHREARHNCYAYRLRQNNLARFSDDGEPSGTAGRPILEVLQREDLTDVCVVVTRYFGGILLGTRRPGPRLYPRLQNSGRRSRGSMHVPARGMYPLR